MSGDLGIESCCKPIPNMQTGDVLACRKPAHRWFADQFGGVAGYCEEHNPNWTPAAQISWEDALTHEVMSS